MKNLIKILLVFLPYFSIAVPNYKVPEPKEIKMNDSLSVIKEMVGKALKEKFGYEFKIDPGMDQGCYNYLNSYIKKSDVPAIKGQGYLHDVYITEKSPLYFSPEYFAKGIIETVEESEFETAFHLFTPTKYWVTSKKIGDKYYILISLD